MPLTIKTSKRFDALETERFREMLASEPFQKYTARLNEMLTTAARECENEDDDRRLRRAQGRALALRAVLGVPDRILAEMRARKS